ncbi:MAG TPA: SIMPL domain-containing protein [Bauldia sp.]|nr:SIMPL domain-containing protein [Bauldia sp.]
MRRIAPALGLLALLALPALADDTAKIATLTASGEGSVMVVPDVVVVTMGVTTRGKSAAEALSQNSTAMDALVKALRDAGLDEKDIGTTGFNVNPLYPPTRDDGTTEPRIVGYAVDNQVRVTIRDIAKAGGLLDKVVAAGANQVNGISFDVSDRVKPGDEALRKAVADARRKAEIMAAAAGVKLVRVLSVSGGDGGNYPQPVFARADFAAKAVPVMPGQQTISTNASVVWEIAPE